MSTRAKTAAEYAGLVDQVIDELQDIIEAASFDFDAVESNLGYVNVLLKEMRAMRASMTDGSYQFGRKDLPWMRIVKQHTDQDLPCIRLFYLINQTHLEGLDIDSA
jgi:hypothetical protein